MDSDQVTGWTWIVPHLDFERLYITSQTNTTLREMAEEMYRKWVLDELKLVAKTQNTWRGTLLSELAWLNKTRTGILKSYTHDQKLGSDIEGLIQQMKSISLLEAHQCYTLFFQKRQAKVEAQKDLFDERCQYTASSWANWKGQFESIFFKDQTSQLRRQVLSEVVLIGQSLMLEW